MRPPAELDLGTIEAAARECSMKIEQVTQVVLCANAFYGEGNDMIEIDACEICGTADADGIIAIS